MNTDDYAKVLLSEMAIALDKIPKYSETNAIWHCSRLAYLAYSLNVYIAMRIQGRDAEAGYVAGEL